MNAAALADYSLVATYSAIAVYVLAFIAYVLGLSARAALRPVVADRALVGAAVGGGADVADRSPYARAEPAEPERPVGIRWERTGLALTVVAWLVHVGALVLRGLAAGRVPWANMYEFALTGTALMVLVYLGVQFWRDVRFLGSYLTGLVALLLALATVNFYVPVTPLPPALQSVWLVIHVFVATLGTGFFAVGGGLSILQLLQESRERGGRVAHVRWLGFLRTIPGSDVLERVASRVIIVGFAFWTFTLIAGAIWAERAWGRYWGWDTKEVWTFIVWVVFAGYINARATAGWRGKRSAVLALIGFGAVLFNFTVVNLFFQGLHSYSGL